MPPSGEHALAEHKVDVPAFPDPQAHPDVHLRADRASAHGLLSGSGRRYGVIAAFRNSVARPLVRVAVRGLVSLTVVGLLVLVRGTADLPRIPDGYRYLCPRPASDC